jgi:hypothetical protein
LAIATVPDSFDVASDVIHAGLAYAPVVYTPLVTVDAVVALVAVAALPLMLMPQVPVAPVPFVAGGVNPSAVVTSELVSVTAPVRVLNEETPDEAVVATQVVPFHVSTCPDAPPTICCTCPVPLPRMTAFVVSDVRPVPPFAALRVPPSVSVPEDVTGPPEKLIPVDPPLASTLVTVPYPPVEMAAVTNAVDATCVVLVPGVAVGAVGTPVSAGLLMVGVAMVGDVALTKSPVPVVPEVSVRAPAVSAVTYDKLS